MTDNRGERIKLIITIGLAVVLMISAYVRIIRPRTRHTATATASTPKRLHPMVSAPAVPTPGPTPVGISKVKIDTPKKKEKEKKHTAPFHAVTSMVRDIFAEPRAPEPEKTVEKQPPPPPTSLKGTIVGGGKPIAIINGRFVHVGDPVGEYRVIRIDKNSVSLRAGVHEIVLEVLKNVHE